MEGVGEIGAEVGTRQNSASQGGLLFLHKHTILKPVRLILPLFVGRGGRVLDVFVLGVSSVEVVEILVPQTEIYCAAFLLH